MEGKADGTRSNHSQNGMQIRPVGFSRPILPHQFAPGQHLLLLLPTQSAGECGSSLGKLSVEDKMLETQEEIEYGKGGAESMYTANQ